MIGTDGKGRVAESGNEPPRLDRMAIGRRRLRKEVLLKDSVRPLRRLGLFLLLTLAADSSVAQQPVPTRPAVPVDPIAAIFDAFRSHSLVAIGEPHGNEQAHAFRLSLIRDPKFPATVNDVVVESGNARYQDLMDRFVRGEDIPDDTLRDVWQNTTVPNTVWDSPIYEEFFRAVRAVNASLPSERRLRVLLGDPPIDWDSVHNREELLKWLSDRERHPADVVRREVLAKQRRALIIYGDGHFFRKTQIDTLASLLAAVTTPFVISTSTSAKLPALQPDVSSWHAPSLALVKGTVLGAADLASYYPLPPDHQRGRLEDSFDALFYLGPASAITVARLPPARCADRRYMEMRLRRMALDPGPPGAPDPGERLKRYCATVAPK